MEGKPGPAEVGEEEELLLFVAGGREGMEEESSSVEKRGKKEGGERGQNNESGEMDELCLLSLPFYDEKKAIWRDEKVCSPPSSGKSVEGRSKEEEGASFEVKRLASPPEGGGKGGEASASVSSVLWPLI